MVRDWSLKPRASRNLQRHGNAQETHQFALLAMAAVFWFVSAVFDGKLMTPNVYGEWVTQFEDHIWAASIMAASTVYLLGCFINGNWRWSPALRLSGALWHVITMGVFAIGAMGAEDGSALAVIAMTFCGLHVWFLWLNISDLIGAVFRWGRDVRG